MKWPTWQLALVVGFFFFIGYGAMNIDDVLRILHELALIAKEFKK